MISTSQVRNGTIEIAALEAMTRGWAVFPVSGKIPATTKGVLDASTEERLAAIWFERHPDRGLAIATGAPSGLWVLDLDGQEAVDRFAAMQDEHGAVEKGVVSQTARGYHLFFRMPKDRDIRNSAGKVAQGIDVRGTGGYVVAPPSPHPTGKQYRWMEDHGPDDVEMVYAPLWLLEKVKATNTHGPAAPLPDKILTGGRNHLLTSLAGSLRRRGGSEVAILAAITAENEARCVPPLSDDELTRIAASVARYAPEPPKTIPDIADSEEPKELPKAVSALDAEAPDPPSFAITGFMLDREIQLLVSDGGEGKTTLALAIAGALANGSPLFDFPDFEVSEPGPVLFISEEDGVGVLQNRLEALVRGHGWDRQRVMSSVFLLAQEGTTLDTVPWREHILAEVDRIGARLLILDPLAELTLAAENSNDDTKPLVRFLRQVTTTTGAAVLVLHHAGKKVEGKRKLDRVRGASGLNAAARAIYFLERMEVGIAVECLKMSRSKKPPKFVVKTDIEADTENPALWTSARLTYASQTEAEDQAAERFVLDQLDRRDALNSSQLKELAKGTGIGAVDVSRAIKTLDALGRISHEKGPKNSKIWTRCVVAQASRQPENSRLPGGSVVAGQPETASPVVASMIERQPGKAQADGLGNQPSQGEVVA